MKSEIKTGKKTEYNNKKIPQIPEKISDEQRHILIELLNSTQKQKDQLNQAIKELSKLLTNQTRKSEDNNTDK